MDPDTSPDTPQGFRLASDATGLTLHIPPLPNLAEIVLVLAAIGLALFLLLRRRDLKWATIHKPWRGLTGFLQRNYVTTLILFGIAAIIWAVYHYLWQIPGLIGDMLHDLTEVLANDEADTEAIRNIGYTFAALAGMLAILATIPFQLVRVWINERTAKTQEANLTTGLINTAVEGLGAEKKVSRIGRIVTFENRDPHHDDYDDGPRTDREIQWLGEQMPISKSLLDYQISDTGDWQTFDRTLPNLEVRIGAILTLDRIARDNPGEHIRVMDILCAYIRENAPAKDAKDHPYGDWPDYPENPTAEQLEERRKLLDKRAEDLRNWIDRLPEPRTDIQTALTTIGNRDPERIAQEEARYTRGGETGYRLDLRDTNLRKCDLSHLNLNRARLDGARIEGATLWEARIEGATLFKARMEGANLRGAGMKGADLSRARMEGANLRGSRMEGADLSWAHMEGAFLSGAQLEGADLTRARLERAVLWVARMQGADLNGARLQCAEWADAHTASPARFADLRDAQGLTQAQLDQMIGNEMTLLPEGPAPDTNRPYSIPSCWKNPPATFVEKMRLWGYDWRKDPDGYRCAPGQEPARTGKPLGLDKPYPPGHPLAGRDTTKWRNTPAAPLS